MVIDRSHLPLALVVSSNLMDLSRFEAAAIRAGYRFAACSAEEIDQFDALVAFVDLEAAGSDGAIVALAARRIQVVAFGPHIDDMAMVRARSLGATVAEPRSRVFRDPAAYLPPLV